jgi:hypothetical protein
MQLSNINHIKMWKVFSNGQKTSPTSTLRTHFKHEHCHVWESECDYLKVPRRDPVGRVLGWSGETLTQDGFAMRVLRFIVGDDQVCLRVFPISCVAHSVI